MNWKFERYEKTSTRQDSSSDKFFNDVTNSDSLIREFIQNSLDAVSDKAKPVKVIINTKQIKKETLKEIFDSLKPHLKACNIPTDDYNQNYIVLEDFNTKGLEGNHRQRFFRADNITDKTEGGGSHGIGKAVFSSSSQIKSFLGYSLFGNDESILQGRAVLKTHKIKNDEFRPYGDLNLCVKQYKHIMSKIFKRNTEKGLSVMIPCCDIDIKALKESCLRQFYIPIIHKKLEIEVGDQNITDETLLDCINQSDLDIKHKIELAMNYKTTPQNQIKEYEINEKDWINKDIPSLQLKRPQDTSRRFFIKFKIELPVKQRRTEYGLATLLIKKGEENIKNQKIDCWRDNLLVSSALGHRQRETEYSAIFLVEENPLSKLLRNLEDPGHRKWQTAIIKNNELKEKYKNIPKLVGFIKKLPSGIIRQIKYPPFDRDSKFFADYFPDRSEIGDSSGGAGSCGQGGGEEGPSADLFPTFSDFIYRPHKLGDGFTLKLKDQENYPDKITVKTAYGTNKGSPFKNYDERDFKFRENITITTKHGEQISCEKNQAHYLITDKNFSISFTGFDPDRELKIAVNTEA